MENMILMKHPLGAKVHYADVTNPRLKKLSFWFSNTNQPTQFVGMAKGVYRVPIGEQQLFSLSICRTVSENAKNSISRFSSSFAATTHITRLNTTHDTRFYVQNTIRDADENCDDVV